MASKTKRQYYSNGTSKIVLRKKQGRRISSPENLRCETLVIHLTKKEMEMFLNIQKESGFSKSLYGSIVLSFGIMQLSESNNCSTQ